MKTKGARLGQHFLTASWAAHLLATSSGANKGETVLEIGPGKGALTRPILETGARVIAVEKDSELVKLLQEKFADEIDSGQLKVVDHDIRSVTPETLGLKQNSYTLAANIPYYITGEIMRSFLESRVQPKTMVLLVQKEVAERITRSKKESVLSLSVKAYGTPKYVKTVSRGCFSPAPTVDSAILLIENISRDFFGDCTEKGFFAVVKTGFASKRKFLANNLSVRFEKEDVLKAFASCELEEKVRAEDVPLEKWKCLAQALC